MKFLAFILNIILIIGIYFYGYDSQWSFLSIASVVFMDILIVALALCLPCIMIIINSEQCTVEFMEKLTNPSKNKLPKWLSYLLQICTFLAYF